MHVGSPSDFSQTPAAKAKPRYVYSILKPDGQSSKSPVRPLLCEAKPSYVDTILKKHHLTRVGPKQLCASTHLGCTRKVHTSYGVKSQIKIMISEPMVFCSFWPSLRWYLEKNKSLCRPFSFQCALKRTTTSLTMLPVMQMPISDM